MHLCWLFLGWFTSPQWCSEPSLVRWCFSPCCRECSLLEEKTKLSVLEKPRNRENKLLIPPVLGQRWGLLCPLKSELLCTANWKRNQTSAWGPTRLRGTRWQNLKSTSAVKWLSVGWESRVPLTTGMEQVTRHTADWLYRHHPNRSLFNSLHFAFAEWSGLPLSSNQDSPSTVPLGTLMFH